MTEETYGFEQARVRLEEIASQVKRKDTSLEQSLDLLEEGVRLANMCTEQIDHTQWRPTVETPVEAGEDTPAPAEEASAIGTEVDGAEDEAGEAATETQDETVAADARSEADDTPEADEGEPAGPAPYDQAAEA